MATSRSDETSRALRDQLQHLSLESRLLTGYGFFTEVAVRSDAKPVPGPPNFQIVNVSGEIDGLERGAGFVVFVEGGLLATVEGHTFDETWPESLRGWRLRLDDGPDFVVPEDHGKDPDPLRRK